MKKVLVVNPFGIGDTIFSFYVVEALKQALPGARVDFLCNERTLELARMNPALTRLHEFNRDALRATRKKSVTAFIRKYREMIAQIRAEKYDAMLDYSLGREFGFLGWLAGIPQRIGFNYKNRGLFLNRKIAFNGYEKETVVAAQMQLLKFLSG